MTEIEKRRITELREAGLGYKNIAKEMDININTVKAFCRRNNLAAKNTADLCDNCGKQLNRKKRFCCKCRNEWWNSHLHLVKRKAYYSFICPHCGSEFQTYGEKRRKYCSHECYIKERFGK